MTTRSWVRTLFARTAQHRRERSRTSRWMARGRNPLTRETLEDRTVLSCMPSATLTLLPSEGGQSASQVTLELENYRLGFHKGTALGSPSGGIGSARARFDELEVTAAY